MNAEQIKQQLTEKVGGEWTVKPWPALASQIDASKWFGWSIEGGLGDEIVEISLPDPACRYPTITYHMYDEADLWSETTFDKLLASLPTFIDGAKRRRRSPGFSSALHRDMRVFESSVDCILPKDQQ